MKDANGTPEDESCGEDTKRRIKIRVESAEAMIIKRAIRVGVVVVTAIGGLGALISGSMYAAGRAAATDLQVTDGRVIKIEQSHVDLVKTVGEIKADSDRRFDRFETKVDHIGDTLYRIAVRNGVPADRPPPPATIKPAPPVKERP